MPTRYLKAGIRDSEPIERVSAMAECMFYRLLTTVDDFGRYDARPLMLKASCFPIKTSMDEEGVSRLVAELASAGLISVYSIDGKPYLQMEKWDNKPRAKESKYPSKQRAKPETGDPAHTDAKQLQASVPLTVTVTETKTGTETKTCVGSGKPNVGFGKCPDEPVEEFNGAWSIFRPTKRGGMSKPAAFRAWWKAVRRVRKNGLSDSPVEWIESQLQAYVGSSMGTSQYSPLLSSWLNNHKYEEDASVWNKGASNNARPTKNEQQEQSNADAFTRLGLT